MCLRDGASVIYKTQVRGKISKCKADWKSQKNKIIQLNKM